MPELPDTSPDWVDITKTPLFTELSFLPASRHLRSQSGCSYQQYQECPQREQICRVFILVRRSGMGRFQELLG